MLLARLQGMEDVKQCREKVLQSLISSISDCWFGNGLLELNMALEAVVLGNRCILFYFN